MKVSVFIGKTTDKELQPLCDIEVASFDELENDIVPNKIGTIVKEKTGDKNTRVHGTIIDKSNGNLLVYTDKLVQFQEVSRIINDDEFVYGDQR